MKTLFLFIYHKGCFSKILRRPNVKKYIKFSIQERVFKKLCVGDGKTSINCFSSPGKFWTWNSSLNKNEQNLRARIYASRNREASGKCMTVRKNVEIGLSELWSTPLEIWQFLLFFLKKKIHLLPIIKKQKDENHCRLVIVTIYCPRAIRQKLWFMGKIKNHNHWTCIPSR